MSNYSERILQESLHQARYYTQKAPSSGHGILDPETEEYIDQADIVAIKAVTRHVLPGGGGSDGSIQMRIPEVLVIEEKHVQPDTCQILDDEKQMLERIEEVTAARGLIAVKWKHQKGDHRFFSIEDLQDTGQHWKITTETSGMDLNEIRQ